MFRIGYNTNGFPHHRVVDALRLLADLGYEGVALTPDAGLLDPYELDAEEVSNVRLAAEDLGLELAVETGSRFLLDPQRKHRPSLLEDDPVQRARRLDFLKRCIDLAADLGADVMSCWAGAAPGGVVGDHREGAPAPQELWDRLCQGIGELLHRGREQGVGVALEPEPGMFLERPVGYSDLVERLGADGDELGLCLDVGHLLCTDDPVSRDVPGTIRCFANRLFMVHLDDVAGGVHEHRMFGEGDLDLAATLGALLEVGYDGMAAVELSRDGHRAPQAAREAMQRLKTALVRPASRP